MSSISPSWPWVVKGSSATSVMTPRLGKLLLHRAHRRLRDAVRIPGLARIQGLFLPGRDREQGDGRESSAAPSDSHSRSSSSTDSRSIPGMEATGWRCRGPRPRTPGKSAHPRVKCVSRIRRRENSSRRMRRMRVFGNELAAVPVILTVTPSIQHQRSDSATPDARFGLRRSSGVRITR